MKKYLGLVVILSLLAGSVIYLLTRPQKQPVAAASSEITTIIVQSTITPTATTTIVPSATTTVIKTPISTTTSIPSTIDKSIYFPVDKSTALESTFVPANLVSLSSVGVSSTVGSYQMRSEVIADLKQLFADAKAAGINIRVTSAYRSYATQNSLFSSYVQADINKGMSHDAAVTDANRSSAMPGHSEHQLGTTCDVISTSDSTLDFTATNTKAWAWLDANLESHGFVLSYPDGKENITGYVYEPWHIRWVGKDIAAQIKATDYLNPASNNTSTSFLRTYYAGLQ